tara:strand:- start:2909 stop:3025 length:117 start_codon:yes stop_codon:yes gene_type:complete
MEIPDLYSHVKFNTPKIFIIKHAYATFFILASAVDFEK